MRRTAQSLVLRAVASRSRYGSLCPAARALVDRSATHGAPGRPCTAYRLPSTWGRGVRHGMSSCAPVVAFAMAHGGGWGALCAAQRQQSSTTTTGSGATVTDESESGRGAEQQQAGDQRRHRTEAEIVDNCKWSSDDMVERLGFTAGESINAEQLKRHFFVLAMHFHPDSPTAPPNSTQAFQNIKEAYDKVAEELKVNGVGGSGRDDASSYFYNPFDDYRTSTMGGAFHFKDEEQRRAQMRLLGDGVMLFVLLTVLFACVVARHNRVRLNATYLGNLLGIFVIVQLFPRLLAAAVLFAWQTVYLVHCARYAAQASVSVVVERHDATRELRVCVEGIPADMAPNVVLKVDIRASHTVDRPDGAKKEPRSTHTTTTTTLTLDPGVTNFTVPMADDTEGATYTIRGVDSVRKIVVVDRTLRLA